MEILSGEWIIMVDIRGLMRIWWCENLELIPSVFLFPQIWRIRSMDTNNVHEPNLKVQIQ